MYFGSVLRCASDPDGHALSAIIATTRRAGAGRPLSPPSITRHRQTVSTRPVSPPELYGEGAVSRLRLVSSQTGYGVCLWRLFGWNIPAFKIFILSYSPGLCASAQSCQGSGGRRHRLMRNSGSYVTITCIELQEAIKRKKRTTWRTMQFRDGNS